MARPQGGSREARRSRDPAAVLRAVLLCGGSDSENDGDGVDPYRSDGSGR